MYLEFLHNNLGIQFIALVIYYFSGKKQQIERKEWLKINTVKYLKAVREQCQNC